MKSTNYLQGLTEEIKEAARVLKAGGVVAFPTYTSYGLAVDARNAKAVRRLYNLKGRTYKKPIHVLVPNQEAAKKIAKFNKIADDLAKIYWPGPLTLVLPLRARGASWKLLSAKTNTIGVRAADHSVIEMLLQVCDFPITATSANVSGKDNTYSVGQIKSQFSKSKHKPDYYLDGGSLTRRMPSTMVHIDHKHVTLLREGPIKFHELLKTIHSNVPSK